MQDRSLSARLDAPPSADGSAKDDSISAGAPVSKVRSRLFFKYVVLFVAVVCVALLANGIFDVYFYYQEHKAALVRIQREQAAAAADKIGHFIKEIESQLGWTTQLPWSAGSIEQRRFDLDEKLRALVDRGRPRTQSRQRARRADGTCAAGAREPSA